MMAISQQRTCHKAHSLPAETWAGHQEHAGLSQVRSLDGGVGYPAVLVSWQQDINVMCVPGTIFPLLLAI